MNTECSIAFECQLQPRQRGKRPKAVHLLARPYYGLWGYPMTPVLQCRFLLVP